MKTLFPSLFTAGLLLFTACGQHEGHDGHGKEHAAMMAADSAAKAQVAAQEGTVKAILDLINTGSIEGIEDLMTADIVDHQKDPSITTTGIQGAKDMFTMLHGAYPDFEQEVLSMSTTGDLTFVHLHVTGTNSGPWGPMPATGKVMDVMGVDVFRFQDGKCAEHWGYMEEMKMMTQLGLIPPPGGAPKKK